MLIEGAALAALVPQRGRMCLLERVLDFDNASIECTSKTHLAADNPLRDGARLSALHACEYAAQAVAVHGALLSRRAGRGPPARGFLAALTDVRLHTVACDDSRAVLHVRATRLLGETSGFIYRFRVDVGERAVAEGRVSVITAAAR